MKTDVIDSVIRVGEINFIDFFFESNEDLIHLMFLKKYIDELRLCKTIILNITYMPYSRMDRKEINFAFTLQYVSDFINSLSFDEVQLHEAHSDVAPALLKNAYNIEEGEKLLESVANEILFDKEKDFLFFPDAGAQKRYSKLTGYNQLVGHKKRDFDTGEIKSLEVIGSLTKGAKVIILDDLCSRGGTFIHSAKALKDLGAGEIYLAVTHCEDTIYDGEIPESDLITRVYTSNSIIHTRNHSKVENFLSVNF